MGEHVLLLEPLVYQHLIVVIELLWNDYYPTEDIHENTEPSHLLPNTTVVNKAHFLTCYLFIYLIKIITQLYFYSVWSNL